MNELTKIDAYKKDIPRLGILKYQLQPIPPSKPDVISILIDEHYELENLKKQLAKK